MIYTLYNINNYMYVYVMMTKYILLYAVCCQIGLRHRETKNTCSTRTDFMDWIETKSQMFIIIVLRDMYSSLKKKNKPEKEIS